MSTEDKEESYESKEEPDSKNKYSSSIDYSIKSAWSYGKEGY